MLLDDAGVDVWPDPEETQDNVLAAVQQPAQGASENGPVSREMNEPTNDWPELTQRLAA